MHPTQDSGLRTQHSGLSTQDEKVAHYDLPLDLPHAGRIACRILTLLESHCEEHGIEAPEVFDRAERLDGMLCKYDEAGENPGAGEAAEMREKTAAIARQLVDELEAAGIAGDRLGQYVRNLFECLEMGKEGAEISLRAGEDPQSLQRPV